MPAWITSLLRELVADPKIGAESTTKTCLPWFTLSSLATAMPTIPAPITKQSTFSLGIDDDENGFFLGLLLFMNFWIIVFVIEFLGFIILKKEKKSRSNGGISDDK